MHSAAIFITELGICRIIPNLNQRVAKNKQKKQKNNNKNKKSGIICAIMIAFVWYASFLSFFLDEFKKIRSPFNNRLINRVTTQD